uniref:DIX domain-containing protein n=1 Tax=Gasterosteus aculeatus aculeatus TaxID=481459 RepID=A0AAQ4RAU2_GASAC
PLPECLAVDPREREAGQAQATQHSRPKEVQPARLQGSARSDPILLGWRRHRQWGSPPRPPPGPPVHPGPGHAPPAPTKHQWHSLRRPAADWKRSRSHRSKGASSLQKDKSHLAAVVPAGCSALASPGLQADESKEIMVTYFFCGEEIPYRSMMKTHCLTLGHFKEQLSKKGHYRYYFKKASDEFECGAVFEEVWEDATVLPMYEGKVLGKVERMD